jgi:hypothetical protein
MSVILEITQGVPSKSTNTSYHRDAIGRFEESC